MRRVRRQEMEVLFSPGEAAVGGEWPVAPRYRILDGVIHPFVDLDELTYPALGVPLRILSTPLAECDAFCRSPGLRRAANRQSARS